jgi:membrane carboxypeptidase/penicillin-binding protein PbpC
MEDTTTITLSTNNLQIVHLFETLANTLNVPFEKVETHTTLSKSMQKALEEEKKGQVTKLVNYKNAVAEILG